MAPDADHPKDGDTDGDNPAGDDRSAPWGRPRRTGQPTPPPTTAEETVDLRAIPTAPAAPPPGTGPTGVPGAPGDPATAPVAPGPPTGREAAPPGPGWVGVPPSRGAPSPPRRRTALIAVIGCVVVLVVLAVTGGLVLRSQSSSGDDPPAALPLEGRIIVVDPGHNGANAEHRAEIDREIEAGGLRKACDAVGAEGGGQTESALNLDVAERLRDALEDRGATVVLTRSDDEGFGPCIDARARLAGQEGAAILLSIHADGVEPGSSGFHVTSSPLSGAGSDILATDVRDGLVAGDLVPADYVGREGLDVRKDLGTLNLSSVPSVIVDVGNLHSPTDQNIVGSSSGRQRIAEGIADGATDFLEAR